MPKIQYILYYPHGTSLLDGKELPNIDAASLLLKELIDGKSVVLPVGWLLTVVDLSEEKAK
jgi:hypothetical protein